MKRMTKWTLAVAFVLGLLACGTPAEGAERLRGFLSGDTVIVTWDQARVVMGNREVARLEPGDRVQVTEVRGAWLGVWVDVNGKKVAGWLHNPLIRSTRQFSFDPAPTPAVETRGVFEGTVPFAS